MPSSNCCFLTYIQVSQEAGQVVWYSHLLQNFPQFVVIHRVEGFGIVNKAEIDVFLELSYFSDDPADVGNLISASFSFSAVATGLEKVSFHSNLKERQCQRMLKLLHTALISHASKVVLKILQARLQQYMNFQMFKLD